MAVLSILGGRSCFLKVVGLETDAVGFDARFFRVVVWCDGTVAEYVGAGRVCVSERTPSFAGAAKYCSELPCSGGVAAIAAVSVVKSMVTGKTGGLTWPTHAKCCARRPCNDRGASRSTTCSASKPEPATAADEAGGADGDDVAWASADSAFYDAFTLFFGPRLPISGLSIFCLGTSTKVSARPMRLASVLRF